ncbi:hypothetical protein DPMN_162576 [Dreissena polymorpha]|uniref:Uncharacterized protein n=1 Tax=Dreissena polymorpha TaxID=45954 RepID=A0A9D4EQT1_DREPO|nr:hypothetical protein DPMN_162576 [Dreissena polymorpha]
MQRANAESNYENVVNMLVRKAIDIPNACGVSTDMASCNGWAKYCVSHPSEACGTRRVGNTLYSTSVGLELGWGSRYNSTFGKIPRYSEFC